MIRVRAGGGARRLLRRLLRRGPYPGPAAEIPASARRPAAAALAGAGAVALWALAIEPRRLRVHRRELRVDRWPPALDGLRLAVVADLHTGAPHVGEGKVERVVSAVNRARPELAVLLGDYIDPEVALGGEVDPEAVAARLAAIRAPLGVVAVLGNHDWANDGPRVQRALADAGVTVLENAAVERQRGRARVWIAGVADAGARQPDVDAALAPVPADDPVILLSHNPDVVASVPERVALTLSGHTHGAQVNVPVVRERITPSRFGARFAAGHVEHRGRDVFVTRGVGTSRFPVRLGAPPEVVVLTLRAAGALSDAAARGP